MRDIVVTGMEIIGEMQENLSVVGKEMGKQLIDAILQADKTYSAGCGRSPLMIRGLAMRLIHIGLKSHVVGETVTPAVGEGDLLIIGSGPGETSTLKVMAEEAKKAGAKLAVITIYPESTLGKMADITVMIHGVTAKVQDDGENHPTQSGGNLFKQSLLIFGDTLSMCVADRDGTPMDDKSTMSRHTNLKQMGWSYREIMQREPGIEQEVLDDERCDNWYRYREYVFSYRNGCGGWWSERF